MMIFKLTPAKLEDRSFINYPTDREQVQAVVKKVLAGKNAIESTLLDDNKGNYDYQFRLKRQKQS